MCVPLFMRDDFFDISARLAEKTDKPISLVAADHTKVEVPDFPFTAIEGKKGLVDYANNDTRVGRRARQQIVEIIGRERVFGNIDIHNITLAPSITSASMNVLLTLSQLGVTSIGLATPCYYATKFQIERIGLQPVLLPTYTRQDFNLASSNDLSVFDVLWITHPIISLTKDFAFDQFSAWLEQNQGHKRKIIVIDEAVDCKQPHVMNVEDFFKNDIEIIRLRSFFKQFCINGQRLSYIVSSKSLAEILSHETWVAHGGVDQFSLSTLKWVLDNPDKYDNLSGLMLTNCARECRALQNMLAGTNIRIPDYQNGYITSLEIDMRAWKSYQNAGHAAARKELIDYLLNINVLPTLAPSMYFAHDDGIERLRLGFLGSTMLREKMLLKMVDHFSELE